MSTDGEKVLAGLAATLPWTVELIFRSADGTVRYHWHAPFPITSLDQSVNVKMDLNSIEAGS